jgi:hypothetical protein
MLSSGMLRRVALVRTDVSEEPGASFIRVRRLLVAACVVPSSPILVTLMMEPLSSSETSVLSRATRRNIPEDTITLNAIVRVYSILRSRQTDKECGRFQASSIYVMGLNVVKWLELPIQSGRILPLLTQICVDAPSSYRPR